MAEGGENSLLAARPGYQPGYRVALSGSELRREGDACEGRGRSGTDCAGLLHTPDCDARNGEGHTHLHACGEGENPPHSSALVGGVGRRARSALGWYRPSVGVPRDVGFYSGNVRVAALFSVQFRSEAHVTDDT